MEHPNLKITNYPALKIEPLKDNAVQIMNETIALLNMEFWMSAGTALGLYRDGDFIKGDTDIDIAMKGYEGVDKEILSKLKDYTIVRSAYWEDRPMQLAFIKDEILVDIYFHWEEGENYVNYNNNGKTTMPKEVYKPVFLDTKYGKLPFPNTPERYFEIRYGKDWKVPQEKKPFFHPFKEYKRALVFGAFDPLHFGHIRLFKNASNISEEVIVCTESDAIIRRDKKREPFTTEQERVADLKGIKYITKALIRSDEFNRDKIVQEVNPDVLIVGSDWEGKEWEGNKYGIKIVYFPYTKEITSTQIRNGMGISQN